MMAEEKILIIEDNPMNMELFSDILESDGYQVLKAVNGKDGLDVARRESPDLVILDPGLPDMKGIEALKALRGNPKTKDSIIVVCTASVTGDVKKDMMDAGADCFTHKPIDTREFTRTISGLLKDRKKG